MVGEAHNLSANIPYIRVCDEMVLFDETHGILGRVVLGG